MSQAAAPLVKEAEVVVNKASACVVVAPASNQNAAPTRIDAEARVIDDAVPRVGDETRVIDDEACVIGDEARAIGDKACVIGDEASGD